MIAALHFGAAYGRGGRRVRDAAFVARSTLPLTATCLVANGVRETLSRMLARDVDVDVVEPVVPDAGRRRVLVREATIARVRGRLCDGFVIVRAADARRLVAIAFGETERSESDALSEIERTTLDRLLFGLVPLCNTLCGTLGPVTRETPDRAAADLATYFEVRTNGAPRIAIGFALTRDPPEPVGERVVLDDLRDVEMRGTVVFGAGSLGVAAFSRLAPGSTVVLETPLGSHGSLYFGDVAFARGTCGHKNGRTAFHVAAAP